MVVSLLYLLEEHRKIRAQREQFYIDGKTKAVKLCTDELQYLSTQIRRLRWS